MKKLVLVFLAAVCSSALFCQNYSFADIKVRLDDFSANLNKTLPNAASQQNVYSQAWIGKIYPSAPPHFAVGVEAGVSKLSLQPLKETASAFGVDGLPGDFVYPTVTANFRVGGFVLPFDFGFSCMYINFANLKAVSEGFGIKFFNIGGDFRYALLKGNGALPQVSLGVGYYYLDGKVSFDKDGFFSGIGYSTHTLFGQLQVSKTFLFFTPFVGFRGIFSKSKADWSWAVTDQRAAAAASYIGTETSGGGSAESSWEDSFIPQIYGGFGLKFSGLAINLSASYDFRNSIWNGGLSLRFQM